MKEIRLTMKKIFEYKFLALFIVVVVTFLAYANTLGNGFVIEDRVFISDWKLIQSFGNIPKMIGGDTIPTGNWGAYRPVRAVIYTISYALWRGENTFGYHLQALLSHILITVFVFLIVEQLVRAGPAIKSSKFKVQSSKLIPFITALLFGLHPVHTEAIDYLTANFDALAYVFFFASFWCYLKSRSPLVILFRNGIENGWYWASLILANLAFFHSEMTLTLPFLILLYDFCLGHLSSRALRHSGDPATAGESRKSVSFHESDFGQARMTKKSSQLSIVRWVPFFISAIIFLLIRFFVMHINVRGEYLGGSVYYTFLTMLKVILKYFEWLVFPLKLSINPVLPGGISAWNHPLAHLERITQQSLTEPYILLSLLVIAGLISASVFFFKKFPIMAFCVGWFFISILPILDIIPQGTIFQERYIYIASFGFCLLAAWLVCELYANIMRMKMPMYANALALFVVIAVMCYGVRTFIRNFDWKDDFAVWTALAKDSPEDVIGNFRAAALYQQRGMDDLALTYYQKALAIEPRLHEVYFAEGQIYQKRGDLDRAAVNFQQALLINPKFDQAVEALDSVNNAEEDKWIDCQLSQTIKFSCPKKWISVNTGKKVLLKNTEGDFAIEVSLDDLGTQTFEDYLKSQKEDLPAGRQDIGKVVNQGLAQIPGFEAAYVKVLDNKKLQFFLLNKGKIVKLLVGPSDSPLMIKFDRLVSSVR